MTGIVKQVLAKTKGHAIIDSCENSVHCEGAERYIERYNEKFEDFLGYQELCRALQKHRLNMLGC